MFKRISASRKSAFDTLEPFANKKCLNEVISALKIFEYKLYKKVPLKFYRGKPTHYEFDLDLGVMHFTELDFSGLSFMFSKINQKWKTQMTFCVYPKKEYRGIIMNIRGSPKAPSDLN